MTARPNAKAE